MNKGLYIKLAIVNIKKSYQTYIPYLITCITTILMFYNMYALSSDASLNKIPHAQDLRFILSLGIVVVTLFSIVFVFYTSSFLLKRRKKELGLYSVLGMEKKHISLVVFFETLITFIISIVIGTILGIIFSKLFELLFYQLINQNFEMGLSVSFPAIRITFITFAIVFLFTFLKAVKEIYTLQTIELTFGSKVGEKEPKIKWITLIIGVISLVAGYIIALTIKSPLTAIFAFFVAVILVMIGTYCLFQTGTIAVLKMLKNNKKFYYRADNFVSVSTLMYRMKQNAVGLANICILSTMVLVMLSTTISLYVGIEDSLHTRYERDILCQYFISDDQQYVDVKNFMSQQLKENDIDQSDVLEYRYENIITSRNDNKFTEPSEINNNYSIIKLVNLEDYNQVVNKEYQLADNELLVFVNSGNITNQEIILNNVKYNVQFVDDGFSIDSMDVYIADTYLFIANDNSFKDILNLFSIDKWSYNYNFNTSVSSEKQIDFVDSINSLLVEDDNIDGFLEGIESNRDSFDRLYGGFFFIGLFLGSMFIMATVLIIYYKQIQEGYDDAGRYHIMQKVGMDSKLIKKSINKQVLLVFFLPLIVSIIHIGFAYNMISLLLKLLNLGNSALFFKCLILTIIIFALMYAIVYWFTSKIYFKLIYQKNNK